MNNKNINFNKEKLRNGINKAAQAVVSTLGPSGRLVAYSTEYGQSQVTKDGVTVLKQIKLKDPEENFGVELLKQNAERVVREGGDGTTTTTLLTTELINKGLDSIFPSTNVNELRRGIEYSTKLVTQELTSISKDITNEKQLQQIATISANGDEEIGKLVSMAIEKVGRDGVVTVEESRTGETYLDIVEGIQFNIGYKSPYFVTDNDKMQCILKDAYILIHEKPITSIEKLLPILEKVSTESKSLLIIAEDIEGRALATLVVNKGNGVLKTCAVKAPGFGDKRLQNLEDIAILTGGQVVSEVKGMKLEEFDMEWMGEARMVNINKDSTTIIDGKGDEKAIGKRILELKNQIDNSSSPYEIEQLQDRLSKMAGGVAIINIGGNNQTEIKERKDRVDDAVCATRAAVEKGILPGGGVALIKASKILEKQKPVNRDFDLGINLIKDVCKKPFKQILQNIGLSENQIYNKLHTVYLDKYVWNGLDIYTNKNINMFEKGIIDPTKVTISCLVNASSTAISVLLTECLITEELKEESKESFDMSNPF